MENNLQLEFIPYNEAKELKELGFNEPCLATFSGETFDIQLQVPSDDYFTAAPTWRQAFKFFREKYKLSGTPTHQSYEIYNLISEECINEVYPIDTHEEAEISCLKRLIEIAK